MCVQKVDQRSPEVKSRVMVVDMCVMSSRTSTPLLVVMATPLETHPGGEDDMVTVGALLTYIHQVT